MPPSPKMGDCGPLHSQIPLVEMAAAELEKMRPEVVESKYQAFPSGCLSLLKSMEGSGRCIDCDNHDPQWATVSYGALLCLNCSGKHRSLGVQVSSVRSITMDSWSHTEVLAMLEGGNSQLRDFFHRHKLSEEFLKTESKGPITKANVAIMRYKTKAAMFYREQLNLHVNNVMNSGEYQGREHSRRLRHRELESRNSAVL